MIVSHAPESVRLLFFSLFLLVHLPVQAQSVAAVNDELGVSTGETVIELNRDLLANDVWPEGDSVLVVVLDNPQHGTLTEGDAPGRWMYRPDSGFLGEDGFTYQFRTIPRHLLALDPASSSLTFDATVETALGTDSDSEVIPVKGALRADFGGEPQTAAEIHLVGLDVHNAGAHSLRFEYGPSGSFGSLRILVDSSQVALRAARVGPTVATSGPFRSFTQTGNVIEADVLARLEGTGLLASQVPTDPQSLVTETDMNLTGSVILGQDVVVLLFVDGAWSFDLSGTIVQLQIGGTLQARGPLRSSETSNEASVRLMVGAVADREGTPAGIRLRLDAYPMPFTDRLNLDVRSGGAEQLRVEVFDALGRRIAYVPMQAGQREMRRQLDASNWPAGLYVVRVTGGSFMEVRPLIKQ